MQTNEDLIKRIAENVALRLIRIYANGGGGSFTMPVAADGVLGGVQIGYTTDATARKYAVQLDNEKAYVNVPWTDHYSWSDITNKPAAAGGSTTPVYWNGSGFTQCTSYANASVNYATSAGSAGYAASASQAGNADTVDNYHASDLIKKGGDTMTGTFGLRSNAYGGPSGTHGLNCNNSDIVGVNSIYTSDESDSWDEGIEFYRGDNGNWDSLRAYRGTWYFYSNNGSSYGNVQALNGYAEGTWASKSDARDKNVLGDIGLTVEDIAAMPAVRFTWKNRADKQVHIGTLAQAWQKKLPEAVGRTENGRLTFSYGEAAAVCVVKLAQRVLALEEIVNDMRYGTQQH